MSDIVSAHDVPVATGKPTPEQEKAWINAQVPYTNWAGQNEDLDAQVLAVVRQQCNSFRARMAGPMKRWALNWRVSNGDAPWIVNDDDIHIFESQKALTSKVARVEEAILQFDPPFEIEAYSSEVTRRDAKILATWTHRHMETGGWQGLIQPVARSGELTNHLVVKVSHTRHREIVVDKKVKLIERSGKPWWRHERRMSEKIVRRGTRYDQVDPFWFFYDLEAKNIQEAGFVGDESEPMLTQVLHDAELGILSKKQVAKLRDARANHSQPEWRGEWVDEHRRARSIALGQDYGSEDGTAAADGSARCRQVEAYVFFDFGSGFKGITDPLGRQLKGVHRILVTIVDGVVVRTQLNPHDRKIVPYAFACVNNNGAAAVAPATWDSVTQMNAHMDRFGSNVMRWIDLLVSPIGITTDPNTDLPKNMLAVKAGSVFRHIGPIDFVRVPDITQSVGNLMQLFRREMEETSGALRVFEGAPGTATETERKVQEQQRSARASFRASSDLWEQVALLTQAMNAQFATVPEMFAAVGKAASAIGSYATITPDLMMQDVRYRMIGMKNLHVLGTRQQGIGMWATRWAGMLPEMPEVDRQALAKLDFELTVGRAHSDQIFGTPDSPYESWSQASENAILLSGQRVEVHPLDNDLEHIQSLAPLLKRADLPPYIRDLLIEHANQHIASAQQKHQEQQAAERTAENRARLMAPTGGVPGTDRAPAYGGMPAQRDPGVTPGPPQARTQPKAGRSGTGTAQTDVMAAG